MAEFFLIVWSNRDDSVEILRTFCAHDVAYGKYRKKRSDAEVKWCEIYCQGTTGLVKIGGYVPAE